jgi:acetyl esterase/lipase
MNISLSTKNYIDLNLLDTNQRDLVLIFPGGGYSITSKRESIPVSNVFLNDGFHTAIYYYREELLIYPEILDEGGQVLKMLKKNPLIHRIFLIGFSAGAHFAGMLMSRFSSLVSKTILAYPVVTTNPKYWNQGSIHHLLGNDLSKERLNKVSLEYQMHDQVSPVFIMHTMDDQSVLVENSLLLIESLKSHHVLVEAHLYPTGRHGVSLATKETSFEDMDPNLFVKEFGYLSGWIDLAKDFLRRI